MVDSLVEVNCQCRKRDESSMNRNSKASQGTGTEIERHSKFGKAEMEKRKADQINNSWKGCNPFSQNGLTLEFCLYPWRMLQEKSVLL